MDSLKDFFRNWFGYSRKERRSTFILLNVIVIIACLRYVFPFHDSSLREIPLELLGYEIDSSYKISDNQDAKGEGQIKATYNVRKRLNLNSCDSASLEALPGIGPVLSARIIKYRNLLGGYISVSQLKEVYGLPEETFNLISTRVFADTLSIKRIRINEADYKALIRHPYLERGEVNAILKYRELKGRITGIDTMIENKLVSEETGRRIRIYLEFDK